MSEDKTRATRDDGAGISAALTTAEAPQYLGNSETVATLLRGLSGSTLVQFGQAEGDDAVQSVLDSIQGELESVADILLGGLPEDYPPQPGWNTPGRIDVRLLVTVPGLGETEPLRVVSAALGIYLKEVLDHVATIPPGAKQSDWQPDADAIIERWTNVFLGVE
jgi:hypothetical protein